MNFRQLREAASLTQVELAAAAEVDQTTVSQIETGKVRSPQYSTVSRLARALGKSTDEVAAAIDATVAA